MLDVVVVRHGESIRNHASLLAHQGKPASLAKQLAEDSYEPGWPLTERGFDQAAATGKWIRSELGEKAEFAYVSPYYRTLQTARGLGLDTKFEQDWRLRERHWGDYDGRKIPYAVDDYLEDLQHAGEPDWRPNLPGSESIMDLVPNVRSFVRDRMMGLRRGQFVIVTHGGTMKAFEFLFTGQIGECGSSVQNASLFHYRIDEIHANGSAHGEVVTACPWVPETPHMAWQHFG